MDNQGSIVAPANRQEFICNYSVVVVALRASIIQGSVVWYVRLAFLVHLSSSNSAIGTDCSSSKVDNTRLTNFVLWYAFRTGARVAMDGARAPRCSSMLTRL